MSKHASIPPTTRASLLLQLQDSGNEAAWSEFVRLYEPAVYRILRRSGLQDADALEVQQEVFWAVCRNLQRWQPGREHGSFRGWLQVVTRNIVVSWIRRNRAGGGLPKTGLDTWLLASVADDAPETLEFDLEVRRAAFQQAAAAVRQEVTAPTWNAFWKFAVEHQPLARVAADLGLSPGAVRVAKCRVLARIRDHVKHWENQS